MAVLDFAAHTLDYLHVTDGYEDDNGDYVQGSEEWVENYCKCDIVPAGKANVITIPDGSAKNYSYTIYNLPRACRRQNPCKALRKRSEGICCTRLSSLSTAM